LKPVSKECRRDEAPQDLGFGTEVNGGHFARKDWE
jgi:hypothetical protein